MLNEMRSQSKIIELSRFQHRAVPLKKIIEEEDNVLFDESFYAQDTNCPPLFGDLRPSKIFSNLQEDSLEKEILHLELLLDWVGAPNVQMVEYVLGGLAHFNRRLRKGMAESNKRNWRLMKERVGEAAAARVRKDLEEYQSRIASWLSRKK